MKSKDWVNIYEKNNPSGFIAICDSGRSDLLTYWYASKEEAEINMSDFKSATGNKCHAIIEVNNRI